MTDAARRSAPGNRQTRARSGLPFCNVLAGLVRKALPNRRRLGITKLGIQVSFRNCPPHTAQENANWRIHSPQRETAASVPPDRSRFKALESMYNYLAQPPVWQGPNFKAHDRRVSYRHSCRGEYFIGSSPLGHNSAACSAKQGSTEPAVVDKKGVATVQIPAGGENRDRDVGSTRTFERSAAPFACCSRTESLRRCGRWC